MPGHPMTVTSFTLIPFRNEDPGPVMKITGTIGRRGGAVSVGCTLRADLPRLSLPAPCRSPERKDRLWEDTCLELFLGIKGSERYWEFNLSPAGHWNVYRFMSYRKDMREEPAFPSLPFRIRRGPEAFEASLEMDISVIVPAGTAVEAAVSAVIRTKSGGTAHWALAHPGPRPDFHRRDGFLLILPAG